MNSIQSCKQNQRIERISETTLVIGTDIAKKNHIARAFNFRGLELGKWCAFTNDLEGMKVLLNWIEDLKQKDESVDWSRVHRTLLVPNVSLYETRRYPGGIG
ncbi:hypothetical protein ABDB91_14965 [Desulfoscipio sp. XC116]|uniref:hypothetical protein n=1 Tax=Desulfoscipio sp. XC116 TaxID=3144975 RepID=UPI00325AED6A